MSGGVNPAVSGVDKDVGKAALSYTLVEIETSADFEETLTSRSLSYASIPKFKAYGDLL